MFREQAELAAGSHSSLRLRARSYLNVYKDSNGVCIFALIAAHGALWASWYLICAKFAALIFAVFDISCKLSVREKFSQFNAYVTALKTINKMVMVETYVLVHTVKTLGVEFAVSKNIPRHLAEDYARAMSSETPDAALNRDLYHRHFRWEQDRVVSDTLDEAFAVFHWPLMRALCQQPWVWFSYFKIGKSMNFKQFTDQDERIEKGLIAYDIAMEHGAERVFKFTDKRLRIFPGAKRLGL